MKKVLIIVPSYNEEDNIIASIESIKRFRQNYKGGLIDLDYIIINDGSLDATYNICKAKDLKLISHSKNLGIGAAVQTGYKYAQLGDYDIAVQFDGDGQHDIESILDLIEPIAKGRANLTVGSRFIADLSKFRSTALRRIGIRFLSTVISIILGFKIYDVTSGYRACDRELIAYFAKEYPYDYPEPESLVSLSKLGYKIEEVAVNMFAREGGRSSITPIKSLYYMIKVTTAIIITGIQRKSDQKCQQP